MILLNQLIQYLKITDDLSRRDIEAKKVYIKKGEPLNLSISIDTIVSAEKRIGKIFFLKEYSKAFSLDLVRKIDESTEVTNFSQIDSFKVSFEFDSYGFVRNMIKNMNTKETFKVFHLLDMGITSGKNYKLCACVGTSVEVPCYPPLRCSEKIFPKDSDSETEAQLKSLNFFSDFFAEDSLWSKYWEDSRVYSTKLRTYMTTGVRPSKGLNDQDKEKSFNFINNVYPEQTKLLNYRWHGGGYDVSPFEIKHNKTFIYKTFKRWYRGGVGLGAGPTVPELTSNLDWPYELWTSGGIHYGEMYMMYDLDNNSQFIFHMRKSGEVGIGFPIPLELKGFSIGTYGTNCHKDVPHSCHIYGKNRDDNNWTEILFYGGTLGRCRTSKLTIDTGGNRYELYKFSWDTTHYGLDTRISEIKWKFNTLAEDGYYFYNYDADETTVRYFTDIAKTETQFNFSKDEPILESLLGPKHCIQWKKNEDGTNGPCIRYGYGDNNSQGPYGDWLLPEEEMDQYVDNGTDPEELPLNSFMTIGVVGDIEPTAGDNGECTKCSRLSLEAQPNPEDAFYLATYFSGKVFDRLVYNGGVGNEHRYALPFYLFLEEQNWTLDDFMEIYKPYIDILRDDISKKMYSSESIESRNFCEFYDINNICEFDNISVYIPSYVSYDGNTRNNVTAHKKKLITTQGGNDTIIDLPPETMQYGATTISLNSGEFVSRVTVNKAVNVLISEYTKINIEMTPNNSFLLDEDIYLRLSIGDYTFIEERDFDYGI